MRQEMGNIKFVLLLLVALQFVRWCACQNSTVDFDVVEINKSGNATLACNVTSAGNLTRWTYLSGSTETILMSFQNGLCTVSPSNSFLSDSRFSYTCNSTVYQVIILPYAEGGRNINNNILACRDALQPDMTDSTWIIKIYQDNAIDCSYCQPKMTFDVLEVTEGNNLTFVCRVSFEVAFTYWNLNFASRTDAIGVLMNQCATASNAITFLGNTSEYIYTCNKTVYQVTRLNVQRSEHNDMYMCTPAYEKEGTGSNWIIKVKAPVTSVVMTPSKYLINVTENTTQRFTCTTSTARPAASVYWYIHSNGNNNDVTQITENITTTTDYNDLSVTTSTLRFFPMRKHNNTKIFCKANNSLNTIQVSSDGKRLLNVLYKADDPYINVSNEYRVIEDSQGTLSCSVKGGNPTPTLSWRCNNFSPANQPTISSNGSVTSTLTWTALRNHNGMCTCTSQQTGFQDKKKDISLVVLYPPSKPVFKVNGFNVVGDIHFVEGKSRSINCTADSKPSPERYTWTGPTIVNPMNNDTLIFNEIKKTDAGQYTCSVHNTMQPSSGGSVAGINNNSVNVVVLYPPLVAHMKNISKLKGTHLNLACNFTVGMPVDTFIYWTMNIDNNKWNTTNLNIMSLRKNDTGTYTCTAFNTMNESGDVTHYIGQHNQSFYLDVVYEANITSFTIDGFDEDTLTVNESDTVSFVCKADSNPTAMMTLSHGNEILNSLTSSSLEYIVNAGCSDAGIYSCFAWNNYNEDSIASDTVHLFVNYKADDPYINVSNEYRVIEDSQWTLSCSAKGGNPTPTLSWSCNNFSPANQPTISSNGNVTSTLTWTALRNHNGICTCTSQQTGFQDKKIDISLVVLYPPSKPEFSVNGSNVVGDIKIVEGTTKSIKCTADSKPSPERYTWTGPTIVNPINSDTLILNEVKETDAGQYTCSVHNTMQPSSGGSVDGINSNNVNVVVLYLTILQGSDYRIIENEVGLLSCSANSGHQTTTLTWNCTNITGVESTASSGEIITNTLTWTTKRGQDGTCSCTSKRTGFPTSVAEVHVTVLHSPDYPTHFQYFDELTTSSSIQLAWNPGYNGGSQQTFYIKYKAIDLSSWKYKTVPDNGKQTLIFTLSGLNANTFYQIIVLSTNLQGNSTESQPLLARTKELEREDSPTLGQLVGGFAGGSIVFGVIMLFVGILIGRKVSCSGFPKKTSSSLKQSDAGIPTISSNTVAQYDNIGRENEYEMINKCTSPSMPYTTLQPGNNLTQNGSRSDETYENAI